jgi:hypothetical protein
MFNPRRIDRSNRLILDNSLTSGMAGGIAGRGATPARFAPDGNRWVPLFVVLPLRGEWSGIRQNTHEYPSSPAAKVRPSGLETAASRSWQLGGCHHPSQRSFDYRFPAAKVPAFQKPLPGRETFARSYHPYDAYYGVVISS